ncbi:YdeI/OmpD-associated family protein [Leucobacter komagatae]|uniref:2-isopropylmalate synthase n=1 Tax=Leucobacter komagatae TaxID=55969 RepID=A0A0D0H4A7_9MICO|nr:YdeI/OmpD-associated family protein [Leucobacter komagatae]KIP51975.1 2-isopropylmalate synthase [Leucobacter komagatae]
MSLSVTTVLDPYGPATAIVLTEAQVAELGAGKRAPVVVTVGGRSARLRLASMGGDFVIGISKANRAALGVEIGDEITATIEVDLAERTVAVPPELTVALAEAPRAQEAFEALPYTQRKEHAAAVAGAKRPDTRERRIAKIVSELASDGTE